MVMTMTWSPIPAMILRTIRLRMNQLRTIQAMTRAMMTRAMISPVRMAKRIANVSIRPVDKCVALFARGLRGRGDLFAHWDANGDGALTSDEVPEGLWDRLLPADGDANDSVTKAELQAYREAQRVAAVEAFFEQLDRDASGSITSADVSRMTWRFLSRADANNDGGVTLEELLAVPLPFRMGLLRMHGLEGFCLFAIANGPPAAGR